MKHIALIAVCLACAACASGIPKQTQREMAEQAAQLPGIQLKVIQTQARILFLEQMEVHLRQKLKNREFGVYHAVSVTGLVELVRKKRWVSKRDLKRYRMVTVFWEESDSWRFLTWSFGRKGDPRPIEAAKMTRSRRWTAKRSFRKYWKALKRKCK